MYNVEITNYGIKITINGFMQMEEATEWLEEMRKKLKEVDKGFKVMVDMRGFKPASKEIQGIFVEIQKEFKNHGMSRSVVILDNTMAALQLKRTGQESGIYDHERYLSPENNPEWEKHALDWIINEIDPDK
jgi:hypothetical protein